MRCIFVGGIERGEEVVIDVPAGGVVIGSGLRGADGEPVVGYAGFGEEDAEESQERAEAGEEGGWAGDCCCRPGLQGGWEGGGVWCEDGAAVGPR